MTNWSLAYPWVLALLPLPLLIHWILPAHRESRRGLVVPYLQRLAALVGETPGRGATISRGGFLRAFTLLLCWACALLAAARPQLIEPPVTREVPVRDLLLAVDLSGSMETRDFKDASGDTVDRLTAVKTVLDSFLTRRQGDRVGLIVFGSAAFVQVPFTEDLNVCRELLEQAQVKMAGPQTAFGDALGLAINMFDRSTVAERVLIALTDGNDTASQVPPDKAAQIARDKGIVIHTVAVGDPRSAGEDALDEVTLRNVASATGGIYSHANDRNQLEAVYDRLDQLESRKAETISHRLRRDLYWWPLAAGVLVSWLYLAIALLADRARRHHAVVEAPAASVALLGLGTMVEPFHFIRPLLLLGLVPALLLWWILHRRADAARSWRRYVAPHLLAHLLSGEDRQSRFGPAGWLALVWMLSIVAVAGPTWKHEASPFADDTAALAIVVKVTPSMVTEDVQPSRIGRATLKIHDLLGARGNAKTALIAYAGTAHVVMPATSDAGIIDQFAAALDPKIMPEDGDVAAEALRLADQTLATAGGGSILWITDGVATEQASALGAWRSGSGTDLRLWPPLTAGDELQALRSNAAPARPDLVRLAADDSDVRAITGAAKFASISSEDTDARWAESGYWLTPLIALLLLAFFRRGWMAAPGGAP